MCTYTWSLVFPAYGHFFEFNTNALTKKGTAVLYIYYFQHFVPDGQLYKRKGTAAGANLLLSSSHEFENLEIEGGRKATRSQSNVFKAPAYSRSSSSLHHDLFRLLVLSHLARPVISWKTFSRSPRQPRPPTLSHQSALLGAKCCKWPRKCPLSSHTNIRSPFRPH